MRIQRRTLHDILILTIIFFGNNCFFILPSSTYWGFLMVLAVFMLIMIYRNDPINPENVNIRRFLVISSMVSMLSMTFTIVVGLQSWQQAFIKYYPYIFGILAGLPSLKLSRNDNSSTLTAIRRFMLVILCVYCLQVLVGDHVHILQMELVRRNGNIRIVWAQIWFAIASLLYLDEFLSTKPDIKRISSGLAFVAFTLYLVFVVQSRSLIMAYFVAVIGLATWRLYGTFKNSRARYLVIFLLSILLLILLRISITNSYSTVQTSIQSGESSSIMRAMAYQYYWRLFLQHPFTGIGIMKDQLLNGYAQVGVFQKLYIDDIGIVGFIVQYGICAFGLIFWFYTILLRNLKSAICLAVFFLLLFLVPFNYLQSSNTDIILESLILCTIFSNSDFSADESVTNRGA